MERPRRMLKQALYNPLILLLMLIIAGCGNKNGGSGDSTITTAVDANEIITLTWKAPTTNADGSALTDLAGYKLYYKTTESGSYGKTDVVDIKNEITTNLNSISALSSGTEYDFVVTAYDTSGNESGYSNEISVKIP